MTRHPPVERTEAAAWVAHPGVVNAGENPHQTKPEKAAGQQATAAVTETPDYPESPQPPHLAAPPVPLAGPLAPLRQRTPQKTLLDGPFYNNQSSAYADTTPLLLPRPFFLR